MLETLAVANYRSIRQLVVPLGSLNVVTGANGSGKSNLYRALRLLAHTALGDATGTLAREGGLQSVLWAGPEQFGTAARRGAKPVQGGPRRESVNLRLGFAAEPFGYAVDFGLAGGDETGQFVLDPAIRREAIWSGPVYRDAAATVERRGPVVSVRDQAHRWQVVNRQLGRWDSMLTSVADPRAVPEAAALREAIRNWRFYDGFRVDQEAPARRPQVGTRTPVLQHDGHDLAAAWQTVVELGDGAALAAALDDAFPGGRVEIVNQDGWFSLRFFQHGLLRPLTAAELSDGTLRYLLWIAALLTPRPPPLMVLNEPETSLHADLIAPLGRLIRGISAVSQVWVVTHSAALGAALERDPGGHPLALARDLGETGLVGYGALDHPPWNWPTR